MSYISAIRKYNDIIVWERTEHGRVTNQYPAPYYFYLKDPEGEHTTMFGDRVTQLKFATSKEFNQYRTECESRGLEMFESDIPPELKLLSSKYYNKPAPKLHVTFLDIEVDYNEIMGFSSVDNPYAPINSIAYYHNWSNRMVVHAVKPDKYEGDPNDLLVSEEEFLIRLKEIAPFENDVNVEVKFCKDEAELLMCMLDEIEDADVLSGWNSDFFDVPYIGKRVHKVLDGGKERNKRYFNKLSFTGANSPHWRTVEVMRREMTTLDLSGRASLDYMVLFRKYEMYGQPSYKLESIADVVLVDPKTKEPVMPKLEYDGSLAKLYRRDFAYFVRYNLRDTEILKGFEDRLGYVETANQMYHMSTGLSTHVNGTLKLAELATINYCHHDLGGLIVPDNHIPDEDARIQGAFVLKPQVGMHDYIGSVDINSLYPSVIRSINISPETIIGQFEERGNEQETIAPSMVLSACNEISKDSDVELIFTDNETGEIIKRPASVWREVFLKAGYSVSGYGTVFNQNKEGIIPSILATWYAKRQGYQKAKTDARAKGDLDLANYYDKLQYVYKIKLNSFYGALTNKYFRFYDLRMGESTTGTGRMILIHQCAKVCEILDGIYLEPDQENHETGPRGTRWNCGYETSSVVYGDTDSTYFVTHAENNREAILIANKVGELCNDSFPEFMRTRFLCGDGYDKIIKTGREIVADRGIFVNKKRYILHITDDEGDTVDKMKVMGLDTKKTTMPKFISTQLNDFVGRLLKGEDWKHIAADVVALKTEIEEADNFVPYGLPKGIKGIEDYTRRYKQDPIIRIPGHVAAAMVYNSCLEEYGDKESTPIYSGMKIKVFYITKPLGRFKSIALPVDIEQVPEWFTRDFSPVIDRAAHVLRLVDKPLGNIIEAVGELVPSKQTLLLDDLFEF